MTETGDVRDSVRRITYLSVAVALVAVAVAGMIVFQRHQDNEDSLRRAQVLQSRLIEAGLAAPDPQVIADALGEDGGLVCQDPDSPLIKARYDAAISNGASGPGSRPVIADRDIFTATALAIETYCPDRLAAYLQKTGTLKTGNTVKSETDH
ncbi:hypothetical protein AB0N05_29825 [Nocardia sp. NPDC051030]|uniref:hypothetical protein n=1 Tax=Nocardia sp. NPDC051030 TaxID=3155162 RepID=UPI00342F3412